METVYEKIDAEPIDIFLTCQIDVSEHQKRSSSETSLSYHQRILG